MHNVLPNLAALRDWSLWRIDPKHVQQLSIQYPQQHSVVLAKQNQQWTCMQSSQLPANFKLDQQRLHKQLLRLCSLQARGPAPKRQQQELYTQLLQSGIRLELIDAKGNRHAIRLLRAAQATATQETTYYVAKEYDHNTMVYELQSQSDDLWIAGLSTLQQAEP